MSGSALVVDAVTGIAALVAMMGSQRRAWRRAGTAQPFACDESEQR
jgi:hypothetical protein